MAVTILIFVRNMALSHSRRQRGYVWGNHFDRERKTDRGMGENSGHRGLAEAFRDGKGSQQGRELNAPASQLPLETLSARVSRLDTVPGFT